MKICKYCGTEKAPSEFWSATSGQLTARCKACHGLANRTCVVCDKSFVGLAKTKACSIECAATFRPQTFRVCAYCGEPFGPVGRLNIRCCSFACSRAILRGRSSVLKGIPQPERRRSPTRHCPVCSTPFRATADFKQRRQIYCSHRCYLTNRRTSIPETIAADWLEEAGLPIERQKRIGRWCFDIFVPEIGLVIEVDGKFWHSSPEVQERDLRKNAAVEAMGYAMMRVDAEDARRSPERTLRPAVLRWQTFTGGDATLEATGQTFREVAEERAPQGVVGSLQGVGA